ncbi:MAG TPA: hypothetical protein VND42_01350 [Candidatus Acidoferrales bacterium]|nr:hypothetical protein [Candidatus Acidoferrales bacterium]
MGKQAHPGEFHKAFGDSRCNFYDPTSQYEIFLQTVDPKMTPAAEKLAKTAVGRM